MIDSALSALVNSISYQQLPLELTEAFLKALQHLMLAQGQECAWQRATMGIYVGSELKAALD